MPRILHLEDDPKDHKLVRAALTAERISCEILRVDSAEMFRAQLSDSCYDLILADYNLRGFDGFAALNIAKETCPDTPFIVVSGAMGDMAVADILRAGATDFVLKEHLDRLGTAIHRALREADERKARQKAEQAVREARDAAESANRAKDQFLAMLSHELRTPLSPVVLALKSMHRDLDLPAKFLDELSMVRRNIDLEVALIDDLLDLSRVITGKLRLRLTPTGVHELINHAVASAAADLSEKQLAIDCQLDSELDVVPGDATRLQQVFWNLLRNSIKFTEPGGRISIRTTNSTETTICIQVTDTGCGIPASALPRIFEPFEQASAEAKSELGGLGLGLAIVRAVVELHLGRAWAESEGHGRGATFYVELPIIGQQTSLTQELRGMDMSTTAAAVNTIRVLLVEDHLDTRHILTRLLRNSGFEVEVAGSMATAIEKASEMPFDVVVSDIGLPDSSGHELMQQLRQSHGLKGIALTGYGMDDDVARGREAGFVDHIVKPVDFDQLQKAIREVAGQRPTGSA